MYRYKVDDGEQETDHAGVEMPDDDAAKEESVRIAGEILRFEANRVVRHRLVRVRVFNDNMQPLLLVTILATGDQQRPA